MKKNYQMNKNDCCLCKNGRNGMDGTMNDRNMIPHFLIYLVITGTRPKNLVNDLLKSIEANS